LLIWIQDERCKEQVCTALYPSAIAQYIDSCLMKVKALMQRKPQFPVRYSLFPMRCKTQDLHGRWLHVTYTTETESAIPHSFDYPASLYQWKLHTPEQWLHTMKKQDISIYFIKSLRHFTNAKCFYLSILSEKTKRINARVLSNDPTFHSMRRWRDRNV